MGAASDDVRVFRPSLHPDVMTEAAFRVHVIDQLGELREQAATAADRTLSEEAMQRAFAAALAGFIQSDATWEKCGEKVGALAKKQAGAWLFDGFAAWGKRLFWLAVGGLVIYHYFGWPGLVSVVKAGQSQ